MVEDTAGNRLVKVAERVGSDMLEMLLGEFKRSPEPWAKLTSKQQDDLLNGFRGQVRGSVRELVFTLWSVGMPFVPARLGKVSIGDEISVTVKVEKKATHRHELADASGGFACLVIGDPERFLEGMNALKSQSDQGDLFDGRQGEPATILQWPEKEKRPDLKVITSNNAERGAYLPAEPFPGIDAEGNRLPQGAPSVESDAVSAGALEKLADGLAAADRAGDEDGLPEGGQNTMLEFTSLDPREVELIAIMQGIGYPATSALIEQLTPAQFDVALEWATRKRDYPATLLKQPDFLPIIPTNNARPK